MSWEIRCGDAVEQLVRIPDNSVDCVVTSPPYYGQRNYKVKGQIGLEPGFKPYLARLVEVFRETRRVLKPTGCMFVNMGDSWVNDGGAGGQGETGDRAGRRHTQARLIPQLRDLGLKPKSLVGQPWRLAFALQDELELVLRQEIIWQKITATPDSCRDRPSRSHETIFLFTKKPKGYFYDPFAVMEPTTGGAHSRGTGKTPRAMGLGRDSGIKNNSTFGVNHSGIVTMRNQRSVWAMSSNPFGDEWCTACETLYGAGEKKALDRNDKDELICRCGRSDAWVAHFASYPRELVRRCVSAGSSEHGCCMWCGVPYKRIVRRPKGRDRHPDQELKKAGVKRMMKSGAEDASPDGARRLSKMAGLRELTDDFRRANSFEREGGRHDVALPAPEHVGWKQMCKCQLGGVVPATVLDIFCGAGTTLMVAEQLGRDSIGIELNPDYCKMAAARIQRDIAKNAISLLQNAAG